MPSNLPVIAVMHFGGTTLRGTEVCAIHAINGLQAAGHSVVLIANHPEIITSRLQHQPHRTITSSFPEIMWDEKLRFPLWRWLKTLTTLKNSLKEERVSLILSSGGLPCQIGIPISKWLGIPLAVHLHHPASKRYFYFWGIPWADLIITPSLYTRDVIQQKTKKEAQVVYNGIDVENTFFPMPGQSTLRHSLGFQNEDIVICSIGALVPHKRMDLFINAFALAKPQSQHKLRALIIGSGPEQAKLKQLANDLNAANDVCFIERVAEVPPYLQISDIHLLASSEEGFGLSVAEAAACGLPNIVSASCALTEVVQDSVDGIHIHDPSPDAFAKAILRLSENPKLRLQMGEQGRRQAVSKFSVTAYQNNIMQHIHNLLGLNH